MYFLGESICMGWRLSLVIALPYNRWGSVWGEFELSFELGRLEGVGSGVVPGGSLLKPTSTYGDSGLSIELDMV